MLISLVGVVVLFLFGEGMVEDLVVGVVVFRLDLRVKDLRILGGRLYVVFC